MRYLAEAQVRESSVEGGSEARYEALERTWARRWGKVGGRFLTRIMPREEGPKASVRVEGGMVPVFVCGVSLVGWKIVVLVVLGRVGGRTVD